VINLQEALDESQFIRHQHKQTLMKNGLLIWNILLTLITGYLLITHFSSRTNTKVANRKATLDTTHRHQDFRIAYFEMDSIESNYEMVKEVKAELSKREDAIKNELDQRRNFFSNKAEGGTMSQKEIDDATQELQNMQTQIESRKETLNQEYGDFASRRMKDIKKKIEDFVKDYNQTRNYSYIVAEEPGFFYYKDSAYNITADVIKGLNAEYKTNKKD
jgi:outer membrane protein